MRVKTDGDPFIYLDVPFTVDILSCTITGHYADTFDSVAIEPARTDMITEVNYIITAASTEAVFYFAFDDIVTAENNGCQTVYTQEYTLFVDDVDVTNTLPTWVSTFDPSVGELGIETTDEALNNRVFTVTIKSAFVNELIREADSFIQIDLRLI